MINIHIVPNEIGVAISPAGNPLLTGLDKQANVMVSIEVNAQYWQAFLQNAGRLRGAGIAPATLDDIAALAEQKNGGG